MGDRRIGAIAHRSSTGQCREPAVLFEGVLGAVAAEDGGGEMDHAADLDGGLDVDSLVTRAATSAIVVRPDLEVAPFAPANSWMVSAQLVADPPFDEVLEVVVDERFMTDQLSVSLSEDFDPAFAEKARAVSAHTQDVG